MGRTAPPAGASICINPITFFPVHGTVLAPIYHTERCFLRSTSRANALTIQNFPTSVQELSSELTVLTFKLSNQIEPFYLKNTAVIPTVTTVDMSILPPYYEHVLPYCIVDFQRVLLYRLAQQSQVGQDGRLTPLDHVT